MNRVIILVSIAIISWLCLILYLKNAPASPRKPVIHFPVPEKIEPKTHPLIEKINKKNAVISGFGTEVEMEFEENGFNLSLKGRLYLEKPKKFRMVVGTPFGTELDMGSNDELFWYWSRRDKEPGLHYASYEDYHKTRLKPPFNPLWIMSSLGFSEIQEGETVENDTYVAVIRNEVSASGRPIKAVTILSKGEELVSGLMILDKDDKPIAASRIVERLGELPLKIVIRWFEEEHEIVLNLRKKVNGGSFELPDYKPKIDMGDK